MPAFLRLRIEARFERRSGGAVSPGDSDARAVAEMYCARINGLAIQRGKWRVEEEGKIAIDFATLEERDDVQGKLERRGAFLLVATGSEPLEPGRKIDAEAAADEGRIIAANEDVAEARRAYDGGQPAIDILLNGPGAAKMLKCIGERRGQWLAAVLDGEALGASQIVRGVGANRVRFAGAMTQEECRIATEIINAGPFPSHLALLSCRLIDR